MVNSEKLQQIKEIIRTQKTPNPNFKVIEECDIEYVEKFIRNCGLKISTNEVAGYFDFGILRSGKKGGLVTADYLYTNCSNKKGDYFYFKNLKKVSQKDIYIYLEYEGKKTQKYFASIFAPEYFEIIERVIALEKGEIPKTESKVEEEVGVEAQKEEVNVEELYEKGVLLLNNESYSEAFDCFLKAAENGNAEAQYVVGQMYFHGEGVQKDSTQALNWYIKAASNGCDEIFSTIAWMYKMGIGTPEDKTQALYWYIKAAETGSEDSQFTVAEMYYNGEGTAEDKEKAFYWYSKAAENGIFEARSKVGEMCLSGEGTHVDFTKARYWLMKTGPAKRYDENVPLDEKEALQWYIKHAESGDNEAQYYLGIKYYNGEGTPQDKSKALYWYKHSAANGYADAALTIAQMYYDGEGTQEDKEKAFYWCSKAAEADDLVAYEFLASMYYNGEGTPSDKEKALYWYTKFAEIGDEEAKEQVEKIRKECEMEAKAKAEAKERAGAVRAEAEVARAEAEAKAKAKAEEDAKRILSHNLNMEVFESRIDDIIADKKNAPEPIKPVTVAKCFEKPSQTLIKIIEEQVQEAFSSFTIRLASQMSEKEKRKVQSLLPKTHDGEIIAYYDNGKIFDKYWFIVTTIGFVDSTKHDISYFDISSVEHKRDDRGGSIYIHYTRGLNREYRHGYAKELCQLLTRLGNRYSILFDKAYNYNGQKNYALAKECYLEAAIHGNKEAQNNLGVYYKDGKAVEADFDTAVYWYEKAAQQGNVVAMGNLASCLSKKKHYKEAIYWHKKLIESNSNQSDFSYRWLGYAYANGLGTAIDIDLAVDYYQKSAELNNVDAMQDLGLLYTHKKIDYGTARSYYNKGVDKKNAYSINSLGLCNFYGRGGDIDFDEAEKRYKAAVEAGSDIALQNLGDLYFYARREYDKGMEFYQKAMEAGKTGAYANIGISYRDGIWGASDYKQAAEWFQKGIEAGSTNCMNELGMAYINGQGVERDEAKAMELFLRAAEKGSSDAKVNIAVMILKYAKNPDNVERAKELFELAKPEINYYAKYHLANLSIDGTYVTMNADTIKETLFSMAKIKDGKYSVMAKKKIVECIMNGTVFELDRDLIKEVQKMIREMYFFEPAFAEQNKEFESYCRSYILKTADSLVAFNMLRTDRQKQFFNDIEASIQAGTYTLERGRAKEALRYFEYAYKYGEPNAAIAYIIARIYFENIFEVTKWKMEETLEWKHPVYSKAEMWAKRAVELGSKPARELLNTILEAAAAEYDVMLTQVYKDAFHYVLFHREEFNDVDPLSKSQAAYGLDVVRPYIDKAVYYHKQQVNDNFSAKWLAYFYGEKEPSVTEFLEVADYIKPYLQKESFWLDKYDERGTISGFMNGGRDLAFKFEKKGESDNCKKILEVCAGLNDSISMYWLGTIYEKKFDFTNALYWYKQAKNYGLEESLRYTSILITNKSGKTTRMEVDIDQVIDKLDDISRKVK